jgi:hypothetical protein
MPKEAKMKTDFYVIVSSKPLPSHLYEQMVATSLQVQAQETKDERIFDFIKKELTWRWREEKEKANFPKPKRSNKEIAADLMKLLAEISL